MSDPNQSKAILAGPMLDRHVGPADPAPLPPYFPPSTRIVGKDIAAKALLCVMGGSGAGKTHLGRQLLQAPDVGPDEVLFLTREDVTSIYGDRAHVTAVERFTEGQPNADGTEPRAVEVAKSLLAAQRAGRRMPKVIFTDSISGLALGQQQYFRENPIMQWNEKAQKEVHNKFAEFGEMGTGMVDLLLLLGQLQTINVVLCTTWTNPTKPGAQPELAVEGNIIPKFITQMTTCTLFLDKAQRTFPMAKAKEAQAKGTLYQPHRIVLPFTDTDESVTVIDRTLFSQGGGEVIAKGHHSLATAEKADLPAVLRKMMGRERL